MARNWIRNLIGRWRDDDWEDPDIPWVGAAENPWGVRVIDIRSLTTTANAFSQDPKHAANAISFSADDGKEFVDQPPSVERTVEADLRFPIDRLLADGVLFAPASMDERWALFKHGERILCVASWLRQVQLAAHIEQVDSHVHITEVQGALSEDCEDPDFTVRALDFLLRAHALDEVHPAPFPAGMEGNRRAAATWCLSAYGNRALYATPYSFVRNDPQRPLRTHSLLHIAVARADVAGAEAELALGVPIDLLARDGLAPLHWALASRDNALLETVIRLGSPVDVRSSEGATPLMNAAQSQLLEQMAFLLERGADPDARDRRGFTALHRAADTGHLQGVRTLLDAGATPDAAAEGHTPRSVAHARGHESIVELLDERGVAPA